MKKRVFATVLGKIKKAFTRNIVLKIVSILFAIVLWAYVLSAENPVRIKTIPDVTVGLDGEADLIARKFVVRGSRKEMLKEATVSVKTNVTNYADINSMNVSATVNLRNISDTGTYELPITAYTPTGTVDSISPRTIKVEIDNLVSKRIPVEIVTEGSVADGYWADEPVINRTEIEIEGASQDVKSVVKAKCYVDIDSKSESFYRSFNVMLLDENDSEVDASLFLGEIPSVAVRMTILPIKTVKINLQNSIFGVENIPSDYELVSIEPLVEEVKIVGDKDILDSINEINTEIINVSGLTESTINSYTLEIPDGVRIVGSDTISVKISIEEKTIEKLFEDVDIKIEGIHARLTASLSHYTTDVTIVGKISLINTIEKGDFEVYVDLSGLVAGSHECNVNIRFTDDTIPTQNISYVLGYEFVQAVIR